MTQPNPTTAITVSDFMRQPQNIERFHEILGENAAPYVQSVLIAVSASPDLMACTPPSIMRSALRAASLGLSCDPALKQAWLVPYNKKVPARDGQPEHWEKECQFQPHYKGLHTLAMRTGRYQIINVGPIYEGQRVLEDPLTGLHVVQLDNGLVTMPEVQQESRVNHRYSGYADVTLRRDGGRKVIGWMGYFETTKGFKKSVYMSLQEIDEHARQFVKNLDKNPNWNDPAKRPTMEMKTVLRKLLSWADLSGTENLKLAEALKADADAEVVDVEATDSAPEPEEGPISGEPVQPEPSKALPRTEEQAADAVMIDPMAVDAVTYAAKRWNMSSGAAAKNIAEAIKSGKMTKPMTKAAFKAVVG